MARVPTGIPAALYGAARGVFSGPLWRVAWRVALLVLGAFIVLFLVASGSYLAMFVAGVILTLTLGTILRASLRDLWNFEFFRIRL